MPQGSIFCPLLFLIYINDIIYLSNILDYKLFADDTCLVYSEKRLDVFIQTVNQKLIKICNWLNGSDCTIRIMYISIIRVSWILIGDRLKWSNHIDNVISKIQKSISVVR